MLLGRRAESAALEEVVAAVRAGESRVLVLRGEAGVGKSALLDQMARTATNMNILRAVGVESEMELAFAALHQLCLPLLDRLPHLPEPQCEALETAFGIRAGAPPDRFLVGLGVLGLLSDVSGERPLLCLVDDAQWLDRASAQVLGFVGRRLLVESIALVFGARQPGRELLGLPELSVSGLPAADARALLDSATPSRLDGRIRDRIVIETRGNPLALLELPRGLTATQMAGGLGLVQSGTLPGHIEQSFVTRIDALSAESRLLLLVAAAEPVGDPALVWRAAARMGVSLAAAMATGTDGLLSVDTHMTFRHPLVRSAVYQAASAEERRAVHAALAAATDAQVDPDRRAWHLAAAAVETDEAVAVELEQSAGRAAARGGVAAAAAFLQRSVELTRDPARRTDRALAAAQAGLEAGAFETALGLLAAAEAGVLDELGRARVDLLHAVAAFAQRRGSDAPPFPHWIDRRFARQYDLPARWRAWFADPKTNVHRTRGEAAARLSRPGWSFIFESLHPASTGVDVEVAHPFFDARVIDVALGIPPRPAFIDKRVLREAMRGRLPEEVRTRRKAVAGPDAHAGRFAARHGDWMQLVRKQRMDRWIDPAAMADVLRTSIPDTLLQPVPNAVALAMWLEVVSEGRGGSFDDRQEDE